MFVFTSICFVGFMLYLYDICLFIYVYWCPTRFPYELMFVLFISSRGVPLVEREPIIIPPELHRSRWGSMFSTFQFSVWCFVPFLLTIVLSVLLRCKAFHYLFGILKLFLRSRFHWRAQGRSIMSLSNQIALFYSFLQQVLLVTFKT